MKVKLISEYGHYAAMLGLSLSYNSDLSKMPRRAELLASKDGGHNKFLESVIVWLDVTAPRYWWQQFDTYRVGVTKQSESTMHTLTSRPLTADDFECGMDLSSIPELLEAISIKDWKTAKRLLPESFLQRRIVTTSYKTLRHVYHQRKNHRLEEWQFFLNSVVEQLAHPNWITKEN